MNIELHKQRAWTLFNDNKIDEARQACENIRDANAADAEIFYLLGCCYGRSEQYNEAVLTFKESLKTRPKAFVTLLGLSSALTKLGRLEEAVKNYELVLKLKPEMAETYCALAEVQCLLGSTSEARQHYEKAMALKPELAAPHAGLAALAWTIDQQSEEAIKHINKAIELEPENISYGCILGNVFLNKHSIEESKACFHKVLQADPENAQAIGGFAQLYCLQGDYENSMKQIDLLRNKKVYAVSAAIAFTKICKHLNNCEEAVVYAKKSLQCDQLDKRTKASVYMHIAKALDSLGNYDEAWTYFCKGNKQFEGLYDAVAHRLSTENMMKVYSHAGMMAMPKSTINSKRPIFIVGMPRSGTSLVEQILAAHPDVYGGGELSYLSDLRSVLIQQAVSAENWPDCVLELKQDDLNQFASVYLERLNDLSESAVRITDKMPHNFFELGLIQMLFPQAQIIHCNRDPLDTCVSIFIQNFFDGHDYARSLYHIGVHYHQYQKLMSHWRHHLSMPFLDVQYEELVSNPEAVVRQILKHCNLEWYDGCLDFHKVKRQVYTASFDQVRQPIYKKSVQRWRNYEKYLDELKAGLERGF